MSWTNFTELRRYFYDLVQASPDLRSFSLATDARLNASQRSDFRYPLLEVEVPELYFKAIEGGDQLKRYSLRISVLTEVQEDDWAGQEDALSSMEVLIGTLLSKLHRDEIIEDANIPGYPIQNALHDNLYGWGIQFDYEARQSLCYESADWRQVYRLEPVYVLPGAALAVNVEGQDFTTTWQSEADLKQALNALVTAIAQLPGISAAADDGCLVITGDTEGASVSVNPYTDGHSWKTIQFN